METREALLSKLLEVVNRNWPSTVAMTDDLDATFADMGLDSLDVSSLVLAVEERFSVTISDEQLDTMVSINDIADFLYTERS